MSDLTKVWNDNEFPYDELFQGEKIHIPPHSFIEMDQDKAVIFKGTFKQPIMDSGVQDPTSFKMIRLEKPAASLEAKEKELKQKVYVCMACNKEYQSKSTLSRHIKESHADIMVDEDARDKLLES